MVSLVVAFALGVVTGSPITPRLATRPLPKRIDAAEPMLERLPGGVLSSYRGLGSWIDWVDAGPWAHPFETVRLMKERGVDTIFVQTSTYGLSQALINPAAQSAFIEEAHRLGIYVVAWYVPSFVHMEMDLERARTAIEFRTPTGQAFDSFALDIEAPIVKDIDKRNARLLRLSDRIRKVAGADYPLGAIVPDPVVSRYWPSFPYKGLVDSYDVFIPMGYFTFRARGFENVRAYTAAAILKIRDLTGDPNVPIHAIGGIAGDTGPKDAAGFVRAVRDHRVLGGSFYDFPITSEREWNSLAPLSRQ